MIKVENVSKKFKDVIALNNVSLEIPKGTVKALLGPNGAGKTTLVRIMTTLLEADTGTVTIAGLDAKKNTNELRTKIGLTGQYAAVDEELTGYENLRMFGKLYRLSGKQAEQRANELLEQFHLTDAAHRPLKTYSGGMRRRLDLAASLIVKPPVLFLDEPTTGLDPASRQDLWVIIEKLVQQETTILLTTQYLEEADYLADSIAVMNKGTIIAEGTADELKEQSGGNILEVTISKKDNSKKAREIIASVASKEIQFNEEHLHYSAPIDGNAEVLIDVIRKMDQENIHIRDIQVRRPTLDDVFIALTGDTSKDTTIEKSKKRNK